MKKNFLGKGKFLIGMIHLPPLLGFKGYPGIDYCIKKAVRDLKSLESAGFDAVLIENDDDKPSTEFATPAQIACFAIIANEVAKQAKVPIGVEVMLNDWRASIEIAKLVGAQFIRIDVFIDHVTSMWGEIHPNPSKIMAYKNKVYPKLIVFTDIQVKHKKMLENKSIIQSAKEAINNGSNGLIVTGKATGEETPLEKIKQVKTAFPDFLVIVGAGVSFKNIKKQLSIADAAIVGTSIKTADKVDKSKAKRLIKEINT